MKIQGWQADTCMGKHVSQKRERETKRKRRKGSEAKYSAMKMPATSIVSFVVVFVVVDDPFH